jgi:hypothetical protein
MDKNNLHISRKQEILMTVIKIFLFPIFIFYLLIAPSMLFTIHDLVYFT